MYFAAGQYVAPNYVDNVLATDSKGTVEFECITRFYKMSENDFGVGSILATVVFMQLKIFQHYFHKKKKKKKKLVLKKWYRITLRVYEMNIYKFTRQRDRDGK